MSEERTLRVFENKVLRRIFGPKRDEVTGECRRLHNKELHALYSSPNITRVIKSRGPGHVARMGRGEVHARFWWGNLREVDHLEDRSLDGRMIIKWILEKWDGGMDWIDLAQDRDRWRAVVYAVMNLSHP
jgi:hypothetical protein